jgi:pilus assembly protein Flp/PilA
MMTKAKLFLQRLKRDQNGLTAVEYAVLGAVVVAAIVTVGQSFTGQLTGAFADLFNQV